MNTYQVNFQNEYAATKENALLVVKQCRKVFMCVLCTGHPQWSAEIMARNVRNRVVSPAQGDSPPIALGPWCRSPATRLS